MFRSADATRYAKCVPASDTAGLTAHTAFAERYGRTLDHDRLRFHLHLDPPAWG